MKIYDSIYIGEAIAEQKLKENIPLQSGYDYPCCLLQRPGTEDSHWVRELFIHPQEKTAKIEEVAILDQFQRKGYGSILVKEMLSIAKSLGMEAAYLVATSIDGATHFTKS